MQLKTQPELDELVRYTRWYGGFKTDNHAINDLNKSVPNWMEIHDTKITYEDQIGED